MTENGFVGWRWLFLAASLPLFSVPACDAEPASDGGNGKAALDTSRVETFDAFLTASAAAYCDRLVVACCPPAPLTREQCVRGLTDKLRAEDPRIPDAVYTALDGASCLGAIERSDCNFEDPEMRRCDQVFRTPAYRSKKPTNVCAIDTDCIAPPGGTASCEGDCAVGPNTPSAPCPRTCYADGLVGVGQACAPQTSEGLADGVYERCDDDLECVNGVCEALPALGQACTFGCVREAFCAAGTCAPRRDVGAPCTEKTECRSLVCLQGTCRPVRSRSCPVPPEER